MVALNAPSKAGRAALAAGPVRTVMCVRSIDADILGVEKLILALGEQFQERGIRFLIVVLWDGAPPRVELHEVATRMALESHVLRLAWGTDPSVFPRLRRLIGRYRPDVIYTHDPRSEIASLVATRLTRTPLIGGFYGRLAVQSLKLKLHEITSAISFRFYERVLANSEAQRQELLAWHVPSERVEVLHSFVDTRRAQPPEPANQHLARAALGIEPGRPVVSTIARLAMQKGHRYMLDALANVRQTRPDVLYLIVGDSDRWSGEGGIQDRLQEQVERLGLTHNVRFLGHRRDLPTILNATDVVVSPSLREGMSVTLLDAMAAGRPLIATAVGGSPEAIEDGVSGVLVPPGDPSALAKALNTLLADPARQRAMGAAGRRRAEERFDVRVVADQVLRVCNEAVRRA